jgi:hypothetical protein
MGAIGRTFPGMRFASSGLPAVGSHTERLSMGWSKRLFVKSQAMDGRGGATDSNSRQESERHLTPRSWMNAKQVAPSAVTMRAERP